MSLYTGWIFFFSCVSFCDQKLESFKPKKEIKSQRILPTGCLHHHYLSNTMHLAIDNKIMLHIFLFFFLFPCQKLEKYNCHDNDRNSVTGHIKYNLIDIMQQTIFTKTRCYQLQLYFRFSTCINFLLQFPWKIKMKTNRFLLALPYCSRVVIVTRKT